MARFAGMDAGTAEVIWRSLSGHENRELVRDLIEAAVRYARIRVDWGMADLARQREIDSDRTRAHDALIDACNILSRSMGRSGEDNSWRGRLGEDRKEIGDFACHLHCILGIAAR